MKLESFMYFGPFEFFSLAFVVMVTLILFISRIRRCRKGAGAYDLRDTILLFAGPIVSLMILLAQAAVAAGSYPLVGIDTDSPLIYGLPAAADGIEIGISCFALGVIGVLWPVSRTAIPTGNNSVV